jgi:hypothetical protein
LLNIIAASESNQHLTNKSFGGGDCKPWKDFSTSPGRRRRSARQFPAPARATWQPAIRRPCVLFRPEGVINRPFEAA